MDNRKKLLLDVDEVICFSGFLPAVNEFMGTDYKIDDFTDYYIDEVAIPKDKFEDYNNFLKNKNLYDMAVILPNAIEVINLLDKIYNIYICSSCINPFDLDGSGKLFKDKYDYLRQILPFINPERYIFTNSKHLFKADIQIDDRLVNLENDIETKILFPSYHNKNISEEELKTKKIIRAGYEWKNGWQEVSNILIKDKIMIKNKVNKVNCHK